MSFTGRATPSWSEDATEPRGHTGFGRSQERASQRTVPSYHEQVKHLQALAAMVMARPRAIRHRRIVDTPAPAFGGS